MQASVVFIVSSVLIISEPLEKKIFLTKCTQDAPSHERRAQSRRPAADDDGVEDFRVGRAGRVGCDHNGDLKSSATAQDENQDERAYHGNNQGTDAPEAVGEECEHYP